MRLRTDFRNLMVDVRFDGRKEEILSRSSFERDDDECGCVMKSRFHVYISLPFVWRYVARWGLLCYFFRHCLFLC